jgi:hypothetical protein
MLAVDFKHAKPLKKLDCLRARMQFVFRYLTGLISLLHSDLARALSG